jgi:myo-inositol-1(or 4)-monophosphatase
MKAGAMQLAGIDNLQIEKKGAIDLVTQIDKDVERMFRALIGERFPDHAVLAEEFELSGDRQNEAEYCWVFDPVDGTTNYAHGLPIYGVSIALQAAAGVVLGVVYDPSQRELFVAERGRGAYCNDVRLAVSSTETLDASLLATGFPYDIRVNADNNLKEYAAFSVRARGVRRLGSAVLYLSWVAAGRFDGYWELRLGAWDVAAAGLMVEEAGGRLTAIDGGPLDLDTPTVVASNGRIHDQILTVLMEIRRP